MKCARFIGLVLVGLLVAACPGEKDTTTEDLVTLLFLRALTTPTTSTTTPTASIDCRQLNANPVAFGGDLGGNCTTATFTSNGDGTITDSANNLIWTLCFVNGTGHRGTTSACTTPQVGTDNFNQTNAAAHCSNLNWAGRTNWTLPDALQMHTLKNANRGSSPYVHQPPFTSNWTGNGTPSVITSTVYSGSFPTGIGDFSNLNTQSALVTGATAWVKCVIRL